MYIRCWNFGSCVQKPHLCNCFLLGNVSGLIVLFLLGIKYLESVSINSHSKGFLLYSLPTMYSFAPEHNHLQFHGYFTSPVRLLSFSHKHPHFFEPSYVQVFTLPSLVVCRVCIGHIIGSQRLFRFFYQLH